MQRGKVQTFDAQLGYGFIEPEDGCTDLFVHYTGIQGDGYRKLVKGQICEFEVEFGPKGKPQATNVKVIG